MTIVGAYEAKTHLPRLLDEVEKGGRITITRHGVPVAMLVPVPGNATLRPEEAVERLLEFRRGRGLDGMSVREMIEEGRRA